MSEMPDAPVVAAETKLELVKAIRDELLKDAEEVNQANQRLRDKIAANHRTTENREGVLTCSLYRYY